MSTSINENIKKIFDDINSKSQTSKEPQNYISRKLLELTKLIDFKYDGNFKISDQQRLLNQLSNDYGQFAGFQKALESVQGKKETTTLNAAKASAASKKRDQVVQEAAPKKRDQVVEEAVEDIKEEVVYDKKDQQIIKDAVTKTVNAIERALESNMDKAFKQTEKIETKQEEQEIKNIVREAIDESTMTTRPKLSESTFTDTITQPRPKLSESKMTDTITQPRPKLSESKMTDTITQPRPKLSESTFTDTITQPRPILSESTFTDTMTSDEPIIERALVSEEKQMKMDAEVPTSFYGDKLFSERVKEGKTKMSDLNNNFTSPIQYPEQLLKWVNMIGGWEQYKYNRGKFGLIDDAKGDAQYMESMKRCLIMVCGDDIGVEDQPVGNINQAVKELLIMKNCYYIYKFKASLPPQYGLIVNANKLMTFADILGKAPQVDQTKVNAQKPVVKGKERIEFEEQKKDLIQQSMQDRPSSQQPIPKPDINQDTIHKSQVQRGNRGLLQINMDSFNKRTINQGSLAQADAIARGIKIMKPKKQFNRY